MPYLIILKIEMIVKVRNHGDSIAACTCMNYIVVSGDSRPDIQSGGRGATCIIYSAVWLST